jgi:hypothetical protein
VDLFIVNQSEGARLRVVGTPRDPVVTEWVRWRVREILSSKKMTGVELATKVGLSPALISQIDKMGVAGRSIEKWARFFEFKSVDAMREHAWEWWREKNPRTSEREQDPAVVEALGVVRGLHPNVTDGAMKTILHRFADPAFDERDSAFWVKALLEEIQQDYLRAQRKQTSQQVRATEKRAANTKVRTAFREAGAIKSRAEARKNSQETETPADSVDRPEMRHSTQVPKRQRRQA